MCHAFDLSKLILIEKLVITRDDEPALTRFYKKTIECLPINNNKKKFEIEIATDFFILLNLSVFFVIFSAKFLMKKYFNDQKILEKIVFVK